MGHINFPLKQITTYRYSPQLISWIESHSQDYSAIIAHGIWSFSVVGAAIAARRAGMPYFVYAHGMLDPYFLRGRPLGRIKKQLYWTLALKNALNAANGVLFTADEERELAHRSFSGLRGTPVVVPFGVSAPPPPSQDQLDAFRAKIPGLADAPFILFLGRIDVKKGIDVLIEAFARSEPPARMHLVIAGPDSSGLTPGLKLLTAQHGLSERVHFPGMLTGDAKWGAFRSADLFALASHQENFGISIAEALACSVPVAITDKVNIWRKVASHGAGLVAPDEPQGFAALLKAFWQQSATDRARMQSAAIELFGNCFESSALEYCLERLVADATAPVGA